MDEIVNLLLCYYSAVAQKETIEMNDDGSRHMLPLLAFAGLSFELGYNKG